MFYPIVDLTFKRENNTTLYAMNQKYLCLIIFLGTLSFTLLGQDTKTWQVSENLQIIQLTRQTYIHVSWSETPGYGRYSSNGMIYTNGRDALLLDTPVSDEMTQNLVRFMEDSLSLKITGFVPNHWHEDCMGGLAYLNSREIPTFAHNMTCVQALVHDLPEPDICFGDRMVLSLGGKEVICEYPGPAHTLDNIVVWIPSEKILFAGCMVKSIDSGNLGNTSDGDTVNYANTIRNVIEKYGEADYVVPGHGKWGGSELLFHTLELAARKQ